MKYDILIERKAQKALDNIDRRDRTKVEDKIESLADEPRPGGCVKLSGVDGYRVRVGDYRIIYTVSDHVKVVTVVKVGTRQSIYKEG